jgi:hypothetical protein
MAINLRRPVRGRRLVSEATRALEALCGQATPRLTTLLKRQVSRHKYVNGIQSRWRSAEVLT